MRRTRPQAVGSSTNHESSRERFHNRLSFWEAPKGPLPGRAKNKNGDGNLRWATLIAAEPHKLFGDVIVHYHESERMHFVSHHSSMAEPKVKVHTRSPTQKRKVANSRRGKGEEAPASTNRDMHSECVFVHKHECLQNQTII